MAGEHVPPTSEPEKAETRLRAPRPGLLPTPGDLERLRVGIQKRLDQIEALARTRPGPTPPRVESSEQEQRLRQRISELEEANDRLRTQAQRQEQEWRLALDRLEEDRIMLADAWDRLELERIEGHAEPAAARSPRASPADRPVAPQVSSESSGTPDDSVTQSILQQFHILRGDVRRIANRRNGN